MVSSVTLAMALAFEPTEKRVMQRKPDPPDEPLLSRLLVWRIVFVSALFLLGIFGIFKWAIWQGSSIEAARTLAVNTLVMLEVFYLFSSRYIHGPSLTWQGVQGTKAVLIAIGFVAGLQLLFTYTPFMHYLFQTQSLTIEQGLWVWAIGIAGFILVEVEKLSVLFFKRKFLKNKT
jgi:magnesium-transporting ATPase (P-type)